MSQTLDSDEKDHLQGRKHLTSSKNQVSHSATSGTEVEILLDISDIYVRFIIEGRKEVENNRFPEQKRGKRGAYVRRARGA